MNADVRKAVVVMIFCLVAVGSAKWCPGQTASSGELAAEGLFDGVDERFRIRETRHFIIAYDTAPDAVRPLLGRLEGTYRAVRRFCEAQDLTLADPIPKLQVVLFEDCDEFARYGERLEVPMATVAGFFHYPTNVSAFCNMLDSPDIRQLSMRLETLEDRLSDLVTSAVRTQQDRKVRRELERTVLALRLQRDAHARKFNQYVVQHEAAHQMLFNLGVHVRGAANPAWLVEGVACQFEIPQGGALGRVIRINQMRLADFRRALDVPVGVRSASPQRLREGVQSGRFARLGDLIGDPEVFAHGEERVVFRYAQAWALVYYLHRRYPEAFAAYLRRLQTRWPGVGVTAEAERSEFETFFGPPDGQFEAAWIAYVLRLRFEPP